MKPLPISFLAFSITVLSAGAGHLPEGLVKKLTATLQECCPDAEIEFSNNVFTAQQGTMMFTLHSKSKTGEVDPRTHQQEGPNFKGFVLTLSLQEGPYQGAAVTPQTLRGPYYPTFIDAPATEDGLDHYWVTFSYGPRLDEKVRNAILDVLPRTTFPRGPATVSPPVRAETDRASSAALVASAKEDRFIQKVNLVSGQTVVVAEGPAEPRSVGSYSVRLYSGANPQFPTDEFLAGVIHKRDGVIEKVVLADVDGDGRDEVVVIVRSVGTGSFLSAHAFATGQRSVELQGSVAGLAPDANPVSALEKAKSRSTE